MPLRLAMSKERLEPSVTAATRQWGKEGGNLMVCPDTLSVLKYHTASFGAAEGGGGITYLGGSCTIATRKKMEFPLRRNSNFGTKLKIMAGTIFSYVDR